MHTLLSGSEDTGKSHLVKVLYNVISKRLLYDCKYPEKLKVFLIGKTGTPAVDIGEITIHFTLGAKPGTKLLGLNEKSKPGFRNRLSEVNHLVMDKFFIVWSDLWANIDEGWDIICDDSLKSICWSLNYDYSLLSSTTSSQRKIYVFLIKVL